MPYSYFSFGVNYPFAPIFTAAAHSSAALSFSNKVEETLLIPLSSLQFFFRRLL